MRDDVRCRVKKVVTPYEGPTLRGADGHIIPILGQCTSRVEFNGRVYFFEFVIFAYCAHNAALSWDFLSAVDAVIDCGRGEVIFARLPLSESVSSPCVKLTSSYDYVVPPHSAVAIIVVARSPFNDTYMVEPNRRALYEKGNVVSYSLVNFTNGNADIRALNLAFFPQLFPQGVSITSVNTFHEDAGENHSCGFQELLRAAKDNLDSSDATFRAMVNSSLTNSKKSLLVAHLKKHDSAFDFE